MPAASFSRQRLKISYLEEHIAKIVDAFNVREDIGKYSRAVQLKEIIENDFNLNIPRYVDTLDAEELIDIRAVQAEIDALEAELVEVKAKIMGHLKELNVNA